MRFHGMRRLRHILQSVLCLLAGLCLVCSVKLPAQAEKYTYTVRFFAGRQGVIHNNATSAGREENDGEVLVFEGLKYGQQVTFNQNMVTLSDGSKYYIKGLRESGKDNNTVTRTSFTVTGDQDYVVAYGILGDAVAYTVNYLDEAGNALMPSETYYGNVGDKAVVAYLYIDGYQPQAYNLGMTLQEDPLENVFNFIYRRITNTVIAIPGQPAPEYPDAEGGGTTIIDQGVVEGEGTNFDDQAGGGGENDNPENLDIDDNQTPADDGPEDYVDIDENNTPAAGGIIKGDGSKENPLRIEIGALTFPLSVNVLVGVISVLVIIIGLSLLLTEVLRRKQDE